MVRNLPSAVHTINLRADLAGDIDPARIRRLLACQLLYSLRSHGQGGASKVSDERPSSPAACRRAAFRLHRIGGRARSRAAVALGDRAAAPACILVRGAGGRLVARASLRDYGTGPGCPVSAGAASAAFCRDHRPVGIPKCSWPARRYRLRCGAIRLLDPFNCSPLGSAIGLRRGR